MRRRWSVVLLLWLLFLVPGPAVGEVTLTIPCRSGVSMGTSAFEQLTVSTTALGLTAAKLVGAVMVKISLETNPIRYRDDGTAPTSAIGHQGNDKDVLYVCGPSLGRFQMIRSGGADSVANLTYYGR